MTLSVFFQTGCRCRQCGSKRTEPCIESDEPAASGSGTGRDLNPEGSEQYDYVHGTDQ